MGFEERAQGWLAWTRTPDHDAYWRYRDAFFALVPEPGAATLEVGCGEGRVVGDLVARGHRVTGLDASPTLVSAAARGCSSRRSASPPTRRAGPGRASRCSSCGGRSRRVRR
jgi:2-polyprenyl-3-methyl-5-hydroxy-6-metoxy-1,4-benzoquinol methylase